LKAKLLILSLAVIAKDSLTELKNENKKMIIKNQVKIIRKVFINNLPPQKIFLDLIIIAPLCEKN